MQTLQLQIDYDTKLDNATYDAIKAFQMNTASSSTSDLVNSKIRDIEAAGNGFFTSIANAFNVSGYDSDTLKNYVPALVFTMYDGFYIYSPFENTLDADTAAKLPNSENVTYTNGQEVTGLKPYIFYSCRYKKSNIDVVITYSLDNYIVVQGKVGSEYINEAGYLLSDVTVNESSVKYRGITIDKEECLKEFIYRTQYRYTKINGVKYYYEEEGDHHDQWFHVINGKKYYEGKETKFDNSNNDMAVKYYTEAKEFKDKMERYGLNKLTPADAVTVDGNNSLGSLTDTEGDSVYDFADNNAKIFDFDYTDGIESPTSNFNQHRRAVIRYTIEKNLSIALSNYNHFGANHDFRMPKLKETDWDKLLNNISLISFLQGLSIGGRIYNGYSIINNNKNKEVVTEDSIYIADDTKYTRVTDNSLINDTTNKIGVFNYDFERQSMLIVDETKYYYPKKQLGSYTGYVAQTDTASVDNIYTYLDSHQELAKIYYTALGRERYSMYKAWRNPSKHKAQFIQGN